MFKLFDLSLKLSGFPIEEAKKELSKIISIPEEDYSLYIENKKKEIVDYHLKNNPFYKKFLNGKSTNNWEDIPIMTKKDVQLSLTKKLSRGFTSKNVYINKTSGSSGNPILFAKDKFSHSLVWANIIRRFGWFDIDFNHSYQARFYGIPLNKIELFKLRCKDFFANRYRLNIYDLSDEGIKKIIRKFENKKFDYINGYTSSLVMVAKYLKKNNLKLNIICPSLKVCVVTSEMLFDEDKLLLETQFGIPITNEYGASEIEILAFQNAQNEWLLNTETTFIEIVDDYGKILPNGNEGRIIVTSLYNLANPFIRYEVGDYGVIAKNSTPKKTILKKLIGRTNDFAILPSGKKAPGMTFYSITKKLFDDDGLINEFVIQQIKTDTFNIIYSGKKEFNDQEKSKITRVFSDFLEPGLKYEFIKMDKINRNNSGKLKQFVSLLK